MARLGRELRRGGLGRRRSPLRFEPGHGRTAVPVRSALFGTVLAVMIVVATLTFGSGLNTLVSHPSLYGWNWNYALASNYLVPPQARSLLARTVRRRMECCVDFANAQIDGLTVPILLASPHARVTPPMLSGHPSKRTTRSSSARRHSLSCTSASVKRIADAGNKAFAAVPNGGAAGASVEVLPVQYPAEIENYRSIGSTPVLLATGLAIGAVVALGLTLTASVRRRRRDLALLKALGFTQRQLSPHVWRGNRRSPSPSVSSSGIPLGITLGRWLWVLFAHEIYAVPRATVPTLALVYVGLGALVLANVVAALPEDTQPARQRPSCSERSE